MNMLLKTHSEGDLPDDDPQTSYLISAWARICKILGIYFKLVYLIIFLNKESTQIIIILFRKTI